MSKQIEEMKDMIINYIPKLKSGIMNAVEFFQRYEENKGTSLLVQITEGVNWLLDSLVALEKISKEEIMVINNILNEILTALQNEDYILIGDLFQYEFMPILDEIERSILS